MGRIFYRKSNGRFAPPGSRVHVWNDEGRELFGAARSQAIKARAQERRPGPTTKTPRPPAALPDHLSSIFGGFFEPIDAVPDRTMRQTYAVIRFKSQGRKFAEGIYPWDFEPAMPTAGKAPGGRRPEMVTPIQEFKLPRRQARYWRSLEPWQIVEYVEEYSGQEVAYLDEEDERAADVVRDDNLAMELDNGAVGVAAYYGLVVKRPLNECRAWGRKLAKDRAAKKAAEAEAEKKPKGGKYIKGVHNVTKTHRAPGRSKIRRANKPKGGERRRR